MRLNELASHYRMKHSLHYQAGREFIIPITGYQKGLAAPFQKSPLVDRRARFMDIGPAGNFAVIRVICCDFVNDEWSEGAEHDNGKLLQVRVFHALEPLVVTVTIQDGREVLLKGPWTRSQMLCQNVNLGEEEIDDIDGKGMHFFNLVQLRNIIEDRKCEGNFRMHILVHNALFRKAWCYVAPKPKDADAKGQLLVPPCQGTQLSAQHIPQPRQLNLITNDLPTPPSSPR